MPICKRAGFENITSKGSKDDIFHDNDEVFFCEITKEIFRDYEDYFRHVMVINSTVWQCESTGKENLTYAEALKSERRARKKMDLFKDSLRAPVILVIEAAKQSSLKALNAIVSKFLRNRYFLNEEILATYKTTKYRRFIIKEIIPNGKTPVKNGVYDHLENLCYKLESVENINKDEDIIVPFHAIRRERLAFTLDNLSMFIKCHVERIDGILHPTPEAYKRYITEPKIKFSSLFIGKMPEFTPAKVKKPSNPSSNINLSKISSDKKQQSTLNKYLVKNADDSLNGKESKSSVIKAQKEKIQEEREAKAKSLKEEMERVRLEKIQQLAEQKLKLLQKVEEDCDKLLNTTDDLERTDQKVLPLYKSVSTIIPTESFGDALTICEFMHTFAGFLSGIEVFRPKITLQSLSRAFTVREINGPLTNIFLIMLGTIFDLQKEEEEEQPVAYRATQLSSNNELYDSMAEAFRAHQFTNRHYSFNINDLPIDSYTISEVLRLHLLASGSRVDDRADRWRVANRNGYSSSEDPGLEFRIKYPEIIRKLKIESIYSLSMEEILMILRCLMNQILTYSSPIALLEERKDEMNKARSELIALTYAENKRLKVHQAKLQELNNKFNQDCMMDDVKKNPSRKENLEQALNKQIAELMAQSDRERRKYESQLEDLYGALFNYLVCLGSDRAYRKYYVLESVPGIFIEHPRECWDTCLENPPVNVPKEQLLTERNYPKTRRELRAYLTKKYTKEEKDNKLKNSEIKINEIKISAENKENCENEANKTETVDGRNLKIDELNNRTTIEEGSNPSQLDLFMCSGEPTNCIVHTEDNPKKYRWSYIFEKNDLDSLIEALNPLGIRESKLKEQLINMKDLIENHIKKCPSDWLTIDKKNLSRYKTLIMGESSRRGKVNNTLQSDTDIDMVMYMHLTNLILEFENEIYSGDLGRLKVKSMEKWRKDLADLSYDPQVKLTWGPTLLKQVAVANGNGENAESGDESNDEDVNGEGDNSRNARKPYRDPGAKNINPTSLEEYCKDDGSKLERFRILQENVQKMASALLQVEQAIEKRFIKYPFGPMAKDLKDKTSMEKRMKDGANKLKQWELSLMESTSFSQVFLHLTILHDCITWSRSTNKSNCAICRKGTDPDQMLLCDECNAGTHMYCMKPKMKKVPEGNWYCKRCCNLLGLKNEGDELEEKRKTRKKRNFVVDETEEEDQQEQEERLPIKIYNASRPSRRIKSNDLEDLVHSLDNEDDEDDPQDNELVFDGGDEDETENMEFDQKTVEDGDEEYMEEGGIADEEDEDICIICSYEGSDLTCVRCKDGFHLECINLKRPPRYNFVCSKCKLKEERKRPKLTNDDSTDFDNCDIQEPQAKRGRPRNSLRKSLTNDTEVYDSIKNKSGRRSHRRSNDNISINTSVLYELVNDIMKQDSAWPFLRPVAQSEVPDYYEIIKKPMDLSKIRSKLNKGEYCFNEQVLSDLQQIFTNCDQYNVEGNDIYKAGYLLEKYIIQRCNDLNLNFRPSEMQN